MATKLSIPASDGQETAHPLVVQFAVPKKLLKRAVDRNAVRRIGKESLRAATAGAGRLKGDTVSALSAQDTAIEPSQAVCPMVEARKEAVLAPGVRPIVR